MAILGIIFVPFAFFGISNFNFLSAGWAAKVDDVDISLFQLENAYQNQLLQFSEFGELPVEYLTSIKSGILEGLIRDTLVRSHVAKSGYRIDDDMVTALIQGATQFQEGGVFSKDLYYTWLDQTAQDASVFEAQQRQGIRVGQLQRGIGATAFVTPSEYRRYLNLFGEQRQVSIATFDVAALAENYGGGIGSAVADAVTDSGDAFTIQQMYVRKIPKSTRNEESILKLCGLHYTDITRTAAQMVGVVAV